MTHLFGVRRKKRQQKATVHRRGRPKKSGTMPPAISDDEMDDADVPDAIPARGKIPIPGDEAQNKVIEEDESEDEDVDENEEEGEFVVEKILKHDFAGDGSLIYQIKWLGYDDESDLTWEPVENLGGAKDILKTYHNKIGGPPEPQSSKKTKGGKGGKRTASDAFADSPAATGSGKKGGRKSNGIAAEEVMPKSRQLPLGSWEGHVTRIVSVVEESVPGKKAFQKDTKELIGLLEWNDQGSKTQHKMKVLRQKCPQKLLDYYEQHLKFQTDDG